MLRERRERVAAVGTGRGGGARWANMEVGERREDEQWGVKVIIHTYSSLTHTITGLMHAVGVPSSPKPITTFFTGSTINIPAGEGLWSRSGMGGVKQASLDAEYWARLGPFKGVVGKEELMARSRDQRWLEEMTRGWVLMRWKEREFVNVAPTECTLTIAGHYLIALERSTGQVEGLYCDPSTPPYQRLQLSPAVPGGRFALGSFEFR
ncbi:vacuolar import and degradation protein-domain-containing protein [Leucosporidium creatinivorum]|uniref:Vacuolar import and degradation protein-domain-containing protein n=1 Tax=Leucosporidium creatinivorum TaxID=106004 RepID=A0A1Y2DAA0_9BASI|nr:vacuolar import and degradation protein-domain-containing protein [Leucosporidium creatinivorum]